MSAPPAAAVSPRSFRLVTVAGIEIRAHPTVLITMALIVTSLATVALPDLVEDRPDLTYWTAATVATVLFFVSLLAHELSHSIVARRRGIGIHGIELWLLGGASMLEDAPTTPGDEARIAAAGPLMSFAIAGAAVVVGVGLDASGATDVTVAVASWLAVLNIILGVFNLLPVFPLDGGRLLVAVLWRRRGSRTVAVARAAQIGGVVGLAMIALGIVEAATTSLVGGLWLAFLGWFIRDAGRAEMTSTRMEHLLRGLTIADVMVPRPATVPDHLPVDGFVDVLLHDHHLSYPVVDEHERVVGMVGLGELQRCGPDGRRRSVGTIARPVADCIVHPDDPLAEVLHRLTADDARLVVLDDDGGVAGIVAPADVSRVLAVAEIREAIGAPRAPAPPLVATTTTPAPPAPPR